MVYFKASGEKIREARKAANLTQAQLGEKMHISGSMIGQYETEARRPSIKTAKEIATILGIDTRTLLVEFEADDLVSVPASEFFSANNLLKTLVYRYGGSQKPGELVRIIRNMSKEEQDALFNASITILNALQEGRATVGSPTPPPTDDLQAAPKDTTPPSDAPETPPEGE